MTVEMFILIGGFVVTIGGVLIMFGSLKNKLETTCERQAEDREVHARLHEKEVAEHTRLHEKEHDETREKFQELYVSRNSTNEALVKLSTLVEQIFSRLDSIDGKIDRAIGNNNGQH